MGEVPIPQEVIDNYNQVPVDDHQDNDTTRPIEGEAQGKTEVLDEEKISAVISEIDRLVAEKVGLLPQPDEHEHVVDVNHPEIRDKISFAEKLFTDFSLEYGETFDLSSPEGIQTTLEAAEKRKIYELAERIRTLIYGKNISVYGVSYLSNVCNQNCKFCPMGVANWEIWEAKQRLNSEGISDEERQDLQAKVEGYNSKLRTISLEDAKEDYKALVEVGHTEVCVLAGEEIGADLVKLLDYTQAALDTPGIREVILNMGSYDDHQCRAIIAGLDVPEGKKLQFRIFQETFDPDEYFYYMQNAPLTTDDTKHDMAGRFYAQERAVSAGFDEVGIGALFGLSKYPFKELEGLWQQATLLTYKMGKEPKRCALPFGNEPEHEHVDIKYMISKLPEAAKITELIYSLARLAMPTVSIVSSERDEPEMLKKLDKYANHTTLFVHPGPRGNIESLQELAHHSERQVSTVEQAKVSRRFPGEAIRNWHDRGYNVIGFNWQKYVSTQEQI